MQKNTKYKYWQYIALKRTVTIGIGRYGDTDIRKTLSRNWVVNKWFCRWVLWEEATPTLPDVVRVALVRFRWEADAKANG